MGLLFTREDPWHIHKTLGAFSLSHYLYLCCVFPWRATGIEGRPMLVVPHLLLSLSSIQFRVPLRRVQGERPMIWREFRLHNIVFAARSFVCVWLWAAGLRLQWLCVIATMVVADAISAHAAAQAGATTMRNMPIPSAWNESRYRTLQGLYAEAQFAATMACVHSPDLAMLASMPVQLAAFLMTLVRKSKLSSHGWHYLYALSLWTNYGLLAAAALVRSDVTRLECFVYSAVLGRVRRRWGVNKYLLWGIALLLVHAQVDLETIPTLLLRAGFVWAAVHQAWTFVCLFCTIDVDDHAP